jgi:uncharacterized protein YkwD
MSIHRTVLARRIAAVCLLALLAGPVGVRAQLRAPSAVPVAPKVAAEKIIVEAHLLGPEPSAEGAWLIQVEEVLNGSVPGSVLAIDGLVAEMAALGDPAGEAARLRLVLTPGDGGRYRVLSAHRSPEVDPALADPLPPPLAVTPPVAALHPGEGFPEPKAAPAPSLEQQVVELVNQERWDYGQLPPLKQVSELHASAGGHSSNMATRDFFAHCDLDTGKSPWTRMVDAGYLWNTAAENIAAGSSTAAGTMSQWINSPGHYANIVSTSYREIGVGHAYQSGDQATVRRDLNGDCTADSFGWGPYYHYWTQNFGRRSGVYPVVIDREASSTTSTTVDLYVYGAGWAQETRFSNDGATWSAWETYDPNKTWTLSGGAGTRTVYAEIRNGFSLQASDTIYLDTPCTATPNVDVPNQTVTSTASWEACDTITALSGFTVGATGDVTFQAGQRVVLGDGFAVLAGGSFTALIAPPP